MTKEIISRKEAIDLLNHLYDKGFRSNLDEKFLDCIWTLTRVLETNPEMFDMIKSELELDNHYVVEEWRNL